jgi:hypothetical protein
MKIYIQNICWGFDPYTITEEEINSLPDRTVIEVDTEICETLEDIKSLYWVDIAELTDIAELEEFDYSLLGFDLDIPITIGRATYQSYVDVAKKELDYEEEISRWESNMQRG